MPALHALYQKSEALIVHAVHTPYRERSHFDGQDVLESGLAGVGRIDDGWLNRALAHLPSAGRANPRGLAVGAVRAAGDARQGSGAVLDPQGQQCAAARLHGRPAHGPLRTNRSGAGQGVRRGHGDRPCRGSRAGHVRAQPAAAARPRRPAARISREFVEAAEAAARFLSAADGPRIGVLSYNGWDTHANEGPIRGQLAVRLAGLDAAISSLHAGMGEAWKDTVAVIVTEFGRTARVNGTEGTDHGMATVALVVGGAVKGGRILADWPGLRDSALYEGRDLAPTRDLRSVLKGLLGDHLGVPDGALASDVFPDSAGAAPLGGLVA